MSFLKEEEPAPDVEEGDILRAEIVSMKWPVESKYKNADGTPRQQIEFNLRLENGFEFKCWLAFYERPSVKSKLGKLCTKLMVITGVEYQSVKEFLDSLNKYGQLFVQVTGYRTFEDEEYPKFSIVSTKLPKKKSVRKPAQTTAPPSIPAVAALQKISVETAEFIQKSQSIIDKGLPLNEKDWNTIVPVQTRLELLQNGLVEEKEHLYFFTRKVADFFQAT